jgi:gas vesicle protein GvpL/GvpF
MKYLVLGVHLRREDIEPEADALAADTVFLSAISMADDQPVSDRNLLIRAAESRSKLLERATFVAIRYGFTALSAEEAARKCAGRTAVWRDLLEAHRDDVELTLKVAADAKVQRPRRDAFESGAGYLRALYASTRAATIDPAFRAAADELFAPLASSTRWMHRDDSSMEMAALVKRSRLDDVQRSGEALKRRFPAVPFLLSGPWPLEVFADADHE